MEFTKNIEEEYINSYSTTFKINNSFYKISFFPRYKNKSVRYYIGVTSGIKRKELLLESIEKYNKSTGGIKALIEIKKCIIYFIENVNDIDSYFKEYTKAYIIVNWENNRLRNIYISKLKSLNFYISNDLGNKCLTKILK